MYIQFHPYATIFALAALAAAGLAAVIWPHRRAPGAIWLFIHHLALLVWSLSNMLMWTASLLIWQLVWMDVSAVGALFAPITFFVFCLRMGGYDHPLKTTHWILILIQPLVSLLLWFTNEYHYLVFGPPQLWKVNGLAEIQRPPGDWYWVDIIFLNLFLLAGVFLLIRSLQEKGQLYRVQIRTILAGACISLLIIPAYALDPDAPNELNFLPLGFTISGLVYYYAISRFGLLDLIPVARSHLIESLTDGVVVLDIQGRVVDINPAAVKILERRAEDALGVKASGLFESWGKNSTPFWNEQDIHTQILVGQTLSRTIDITITPLLHRGGQNTGRLIILRDITARRQSELALLEANQLMNTQLVEIRALRDQLSDQAIRDPLTGLFNRRYLDETLNMELARARRENHPVAVIMIDIDRFKRINDTLGHRVGDLTLQALALMILQKIRSFDIACRYGGEEFVVVMPGTSLETARFRAEDLRRGFLLLDVAELKGKPHPTLSIGVAAFPVNGASGDVILDSADQAMYAAKRAGRNRTVIQMDEL